MHVFFFGSSSWCPAGCTSWTETLFATFFRFWWDTLPRSISSIGDDGDIFSLGGELLVLDGALLPLPVFICWLSLLVCCSSRDWILLLPSALQGKENMTVYILKLSFKGIYHEINDKSIWLWTQKCYYLVFLTAMLLLSFSRRYSPVSWLTMRIHSFI